MFEPKFTITNKILKNVGVIEACKEVIENAPLVPAWEAKFREEAVVRTVHHGTHIEGNELSLAQAQRVIEGERVVAKERDVQEVINYRNVIRYIDEEGRKREKYTEGELKKLHRLTCERILEKEKCGRYRQVRVVIKDSATGEITFSPPPPVEVPFQLEAFFGWLNSKKGREVHPVLRAGITHYELVRIHPFLDGNGRVARAMATLVLFREGYDVKRFFSLEEHYDRDALGYYRALQSVERRGGEMTGWLEYFTEGLAIELAKIKEKVRRLSIDLRLKRKAGGQIALSERQLKLVEYLEEHGQITMAEATRLIPMVSEDTLLRDLKDLQKKGILVKRGVTKGTRYVLRGR